MTTREEKKVRDWVDSRDGLADVDAAEVDMDKTDMADDKDGDEDGNLGR